MNLKENYIMSKSKREYFECSCLSEGIYVSIETDDELPDCIDVGFFSYGIGSPKDISWKNRFRHIWRIVTHGQPWNDMITLDKKTAEALGKHLLKIARAKD